MSRYFVERKKAGEGMRKWRRARQMPCRDPMDEWLGASARKSSRWLRKGYFQVREILCAADSVKTEETHLVVDYSRQNYGWNYLLA